MDISPPPVGIVIVRESALGALQKCVDRNVRVKASAVGEVRHIWQHKLREGIHWGPILDPVSVENLKSNVKVRSQYLASNCHAWNAPV